MSFPRYPKYKDSSVEWLGEVPDHWQLRRVRRLFEIKKRVAGELGHDVLSITQQGIRIKDLESNEGQLSMDYSKYQFVEIGDFAMNHMDLLTGYIDISPVRGVTSPDYRVFMTRDPDACIDRYFLYLFQSGYDNRIFYAFGQGSSQLGRWRLPTEQFNELVFPLPSKPEQQCIADFLDRETTKIDALVAEQRRLIELLKEKRQAATAQAVTKGLNPHAPMKDSGIEWLGEVPAHWRGTRLRVLFRQQKRQDQEDKEVLSVYRDYGVILKDSRDDNLNKTPEDLSSYQLVNPGDLVVNKMKAWQGSLGVSDLEGITSPDYVVFAPYHQEDSRFLHLLLRSHRLSSVYLSISNGIRPAQWRLEPDLFLGLRIFLPPIDEQRELASFIVEHTSRFDALAVEAQRAIDLLQERRTTLISAAVTGQIDVRQLAEKQAAA